jgi:Rieske Fe-S protein
VLEQGGKLVALSTVCPHLGCGIDYVADKKQFLCACHKSWFHLDGSVDEGPSPRAMDELEIDVDEKLVSVRYRRFKQGVEEKEPIG